MTVKSWGKRVWNKATSTDPLDLFGTKAKNAARIQEKAQEENLAQQKEIYGTNQELIGTGTDKSIGAITGYGDRARNQLGKYYGEQQGYLGQVGGALQQGFQGAQGQLQTGYGQARQDLGGVDTQSALGSNFMQDPGYQFRLQQGQQAMDRAQAAAGGRYSGAALKAGMAYNQGMASQEFANAAARDAQLRGMQMQQGQGLANLSAQQGSQQAGLYSDLAANQANALGQQAGAAQTYGQNRADLLMNTGNQLAGTYQNQINAGLQNSGLLSQAYSNYAQIPGTAEQAQNNAQFRGADTVASFVGSLFGGGKR